MPDPVNISGSGEPIYTDPANVISLSKPILSNVLDPLDSPEIVYAEPMDVIKTPYPVSANQPTSTPPTMSYSKSPEPVYASPVDCVCPRPDPDHCLYADLSEPVYSEVSNDIPDTVEPLHSQQEAVYSEPEEGAYPRTDLPEDAVKSKVTEDQPMDDPSALYSKVNKPPKLSQISQVSKPPKLSQSRHRLPHHGELSLDIVYEDMGFIWISFPAKPDDSTFPLPLTGVWSMPISPALNRCVVQKSQTCRSKAFHTKYVVFMLMTNGVRNGLLMVYFL